MADKLGMDPARIARLRSPDRLEYFDPDRIWDILNPKPDCTLVDIGTGVGFIALPFAGRYPASLVYGCDILDGMIELLRKDAASKGLANVQCIRMSPAAVDLPDETADIIVMAQLHHELDMAEPLLIECRRLLKDGGMVVIVDWKDEDNGKSPPAGRRVSKAKIRAQLEATGFTELKSYQLFEFHNMLTGIARNSTL